MALSRTEVQRVARLARLRLSEDELERFAGQLGRVVDYIDRIADFETAASGVEAARSVSIEAPDVLAPGLDREHFAANAPQIDGVYLVVPGVLKSER